MKVNYADITTPLDYVCSHCGKSGVKLWRLYQSFDAELLCVNCAADDQHKTITHIYENGSMLIAESHAPDFPSDQIGWYIPAVPDEEGVGYWGYTSVPQDGVEWWKRLPNGR